MDAFIRNLAREAGEKVLKRFGKDGFHYGKSEHRMDAVTKADLMADKFITSAIKKKYPDHGIISEEGGYYREDSEYIWIIDPIDGTLNFSLGVPEFGVMIALARNGVVQLAVVYLPVWKELFFAKRGRGAFLNGKSIHCSGVVDLKKSIGTGNTGFRGRFGIFIQNIFAASLNEHLLFNSFANMASNACYVASGRRDWIVSVFGQIHDFAPVSLILEESGCVVTDTKGSPWKLGINEFVAANPTLHRELLKLTKNI